MAALESHRCLGYLPEHTGCSVERDIPEHDVVSTEINVRGDAFANNLHVLRIFDTRCEPSHHLRVDIDSGHRANFGRDQVREESFTGSKFEHRLVFLQTNRTDYLAGDRSGSEKMLSELGVSWLT